MEQKLSTLSEHMSSLSIISVVSVVKSFLCNILFIIVCLSFTSNSPFRICKLYRVCEWLLLNAK